MESVSCGPPRQILRFERLGIGIRGEERLVGSAPGGDHRGGGL